MTSNSDSVLHEQLLDLITTREAAEIVGLSGATLRSWHNQNIGPRSVRIGGRILYRRSDVHAWVDRQIAATSRGDEIDTIDGQLSVDDLDEPTPDD